MNTANIYSGKWETTKYTFCRKKISTFNFQCIYYFWNVPFLECAVFGMCPFWNVPFLNCALFGVCSFWNVLYLECALF